MEYGTIRGVGLPVPRIIQGTRLLPLADSGRCREVFEAALEAGCHAFEAAAVYGEGRAEEVLGKWVRDAGVRDQVTLITKGCHPDLSTWRRRMGPEDLEHDVSASLERLQTDLIDVYLLHRDDAGVPVGEVVDALEGQRRRGRVAAYGASNWAHQRIVEAQRYAASMAAAGFSASSPGLALAKPVRSWPGCLSLEMPEDEEVVRWHEEHGTPILGWSPLAGGFLSEKVSDDPCDREAARFYTSNENVGRRERLRRLAREKGMRLPQAALAYVLSLSPAVHAIVGCRTPEEIRELSSVKERLSPDEILSLTTP